MSMKKAATFRVDLIGADIAWNAGPGKLREFRADGNVGAIEALCARRKRFYECRVTNLL